MVCKLHLNKVINKERKKPLKDFKQGGSDHSPGEVMGWWCSIFRSERAPWSGPNSNSEPGNMCQPPALILWVKMLLPPEALPTTKIDSLMQTEPRWGKTPLKTPSRASPFPSLRGHQSFQTHRAWTGRIGWLLWRGYKSPRSQVHSHPGKIPKGAKPIQCLTREDGDTQMMNKISVSEPVICFAH